MNPIKQIIDAKISGDGEALNEASLSRLYRLAGKGTFAIISANRASNSDAVNRANYKALKNDIRSLTAKPRGAFKARGGQLGFNELIGHWQECQDKDIPYTECPDKEKMDTTEPSLFVYGITKEQAQKISNSYDQDGFIFGEDGNVSLVFKDGTSQSIGGFNPAKIAQGYSELKKDRPRTGMDAKSPRVRRKFVFEAVICGHGFIDGMMIEAARRQYDPAQLVESGIVI